jgi:PAS domain S-box-containing protein
MALVPSSLFNRVTGTVRRPGFWFIVVLLILITLLHYGEVFKYPGIFLNIISELELDRHAFERILYLAPVVWAGFLFGWKGAFVTSVVVLICMLPRTIFISEYPRDAIVESSAVFIIGNTLAISFHSLRREREHRIELEITQQELRTSEERYRQLFENAHDAIWLHDLEGNIVAVNQAAEKLTGYSEEELCKMNVKSFLAEDSLNLAQQIRSKILNNESVEQPYEQRLFRRDGTEAFIQLATSLILSDNKPAAFQHIARDVTEQKRMDENLRFYLQEATRAQEEERKRISHELHDDTIQALVVLSRQLDALSSNERMSPENRRRLEELWQKTDDIVKGVRRLSQDLRPAALDRLGLLPALEWLASNVTEYSGIATRVNVVGEERHPPEEVTVALFRIAQEALRNVWRHSAATSTEITVEFDTTMTRITVTDNGRGFDPPGNLGDMTKNGKLGLVGMQERAQLVGGKLIIQSQPGQGSSITVEVPA